MVECNLAKVDVAGSNPVSRSTKKRRHTQVAKGEVCKTFMLRFESGCRLHYKKAQYTLLGLFMSHDTLKKLLQGFCYHFRWCVDYPNIIESLEGT